MRPTKQVLTEARAKIADRANWTQGTAARDQYNTAVYPFSNNACKWCSVGAVRAVTPIGGEQVSARHALDAATRAFGGGDIVSANDTLSHNFVLKIFDTAIAMTISDDSIGAAL